MAVRIQGNGSMCACVRAGECDSERACVCAGESDPAYRSFRVHPPFGEGGQEIPHPSLVWITGSSRGITPVPISPSPPRQLGEGAEGQRVVLRCGPEIHHSGVPARPRPLLSHRLTQSERVCACVKAVPLGPDGPRTPAGQVDKDKLTKELDIAKNRAQRYAGEADLQDKGMEHCSAC